MYASIEDLCDQFGWSPCGAVNQEGRAQRLAIRVESGDEALLYRWDSDRACARATWCHSKGVGPELFIVPECLESGVNWMVVEAIHGIPLVDFIGSRTHEVALSPLLLQDLGENIRKLHSLESEAVFGDVLQESESRWLTFNGYVAAHFEAYSEDVRKLDFTDATIRQVAERIGEMRHELSSFHPRSPSSLVHGRLAFEHIWVDEHGREVVGFTGFDNAAYLPAEIDLAWILWMEGLGETQSLLRSLFRGYGAARTMDVQRRERFYRRLRAFQALFGAIECDTKTQEDLVHLTCARS